MVTILLRECVGTPSFSVALIKSKVMFLPDRQSTHTIPEVESFRSEADRQQACAEEDNEQNINTDKINVIVYMQLNKAIKFEFNDS